eukprot:TRINITY_DN26635_c0_g1_i1.p1 TRINITY_DN26635_c0_g1~~TRINITY_DN26635_c0_g1_i1.p1  ORF type:complete len:280 (-),score=19.04 TRINITY_DN26635_c0_g1_i1:197-1036(-)
MVCEIGPEPSLRRRVFLDVDEGYMDVDRFTWRLRGFVSPFVPILVLDSGRRSLSGLHDSCALAFVDLNGDISAVAVSGVRDVQSVSATLTHALSGSLLIDLHDQSKNKTLAHTARLSQITGGGSLHIETAQFSPDGQQVVFSLQNADMEFVAFLWDVATGMLVRTFCMRPSRFDMSGLDLVDNMGRVWDCSGCLRWNKGFHEVMPHHLRCMVAVLVALGRVEGSGLESIAYRVFEMIMGAVRELQRDPTHPCVTRQAERSMKAYRQSATKVPLPIFCTC